MSNKMKFAKIRQENGQYSQTISIGVDAQNVDLADGRTLAQVVDNLLEYDDFAEPFTQSKVYNIGDYVFYNDNLYRFKSKHNVNVAWSNTLVDEVVLTDQLSKVIQIKTEQPTDGANKIWVNPNGSDNIEIVTYEEFKNFEKATITEEFDITKAYSVGDYVIFEDRLYKFINNHAKNQSWNQTQVQQIKISNELKRIEGVEDDCVRYDIVQSKTQSEKLQARNNEDAAGITSFAPSYSAASTYAVGDMVTYNGKMYKCTTAIENVESWTAGHWTEVAVSDEISTLKEDLTKFTGNASVSNWNTGYYTLSSNITSVDPSVITTNKYYRCAYLDCSEGDVFYYTGIGTASARSWALLDANNNIIYKAHAGTFTDEKITIPQGVEHIVFNVQAFDYSTYHVFIGEPLANQVEENRNSIAENKTSIDGLEKSLSAIYSTKSVNVVSEYIGEFAVVEDISATGATSLTVGTVQMFEAIYNGLSGYGVTVVKNTDGTYTIDGTATNVVWMYLNQSTRIGTDNLLTLDGKYTISYEIIAGTYRAVTYTGSTFGIIGVLKSDGTQLLINTLENNVKTKKSNTGTISDNVVVALRLTSGVQYDNMRIAITLNKGDVSYPYVPYVKPTTVTDFTDIKNIINRYTPYIQLTASPSTTNIIITGKIIDIESGDNEPTASPSLSDILTKYNDRVDLLTQLFTRQLFLVYTDIHNKADNLARIKEWYSANKPAYVKDIYCLGDMVTDQATDTLTFADDSFWKATLKVIGNHDVLTNSKIPGITSIETYNKYLSADIENWGVIQPTGAAANGLTYYYKDYSNKIRVIVLDTYFYTTEQHTWFVNTLESARTNDLAVIVAQHEDICTASEKQPLNNEYPFGSKYKGFDGLQYRTYGDGGNYQTKRDAVNDFIGNGGTFVCWLSGHMHTDMTGYYQGTNGKQLSIVLTNASTSMTSSIRINNYCQDSFNYIAVDTDEGCIYILRIGLDADKWYHKNRFMRYNYINHIVEEYN